MPRARRVQGHEAAGVWRSARTLLARFVAERRARWSAGTMVNARPRSEGGARASGCSGKWGRVRARESESWRRHLRRNGFYGLLSYWLNFFSPPIFFMFGQELKFSLSDCRYHQPGMDGPDIHGPWPICIYQIFCWTRAPHQFSQLTTFLIANSLSIHGP